MDQREFLIDSFRKLGIELSERQCAQFLRYASLLEEWNQVMNLTAITTFEEVVIKHFADSCAPLLFPETAGLFSGRKTADIGTGAGFPGIPLKILIPDMKLTLLDSLRKRLDFLKTVCSELELTQVETVHARAEDGARDPALRERFDLCVSRAVASMPVLSEYTLPYVRRGGKLIAYKSGAAEEEVAHSTKAAALLGGDKPEVIPFVLPGTDLSRSLVLVEKIRPTPLRYPRKAGTVSRKPLG
ncbi:MAG: 16S rRNA (guanine(527)-N(7))-methyltransferase RsmG [Lachnospiraceae bacterium]|nr:16S rRNA (guanine(527)-N(7))-methyltransferase RsmG [Lachnospiraceae bacterium]